jgi:23S rRNA (guanosine2251-2'-O)-methyltransferase
MTTRRQLLSNHNRCWIWGRNAVLETVRAARWTMLEVIYSERCDPKILDEVLALAGQHRIEIGFVDDAEIARKCRSEEHQGLAARMTPFPYWDLNHLLEGLPTNPVLVLLDRIQDSHNLGAIIRSADVLGIHGIIIGTREQSQVNSQVARSSAGAVNYVPIAQSEDLVATVQLLKNDGFQIVGTSDRANESVFDADLCQSTVLIIGNEGSGIQPSLASLCDRFVQIPVLGQVSSLNAAVSAGILFYEVLRQRQPRPF